MRDIRDVHAAWEHRLPEATESLTRRAQKVTHLMASNSSGGSSGGGGLRDRRKMPTTGGALRPRVLMLAVVLPLLAFLFLCALYEYRFLVVADGEL